MLQEPGLSTVRPPEDTVAGPFSAVAACPPGFAIAARRRSSNPDYRRPAWATNCRGQPGRRVALDSLARIAHPGTARGGQCLLHGLSLHRSTATGRALAGAWTRLAAAAAYEMVGGWTCGDLSLGLRDLCAVEQPAVDGLDRLGYFVTAFAVDGLFPAGTFCKYVCPIGQFNFVQSLVSPLEVQVRSPNVCASCTTHECIRGSLVAPGCQSRLFQPHKSSNMDCTFCLDCVHACPHANVGILAGVPGRELWRDSFRSGIGRFARRTDLAALVVVLVFGSLVERRGDGRTGPGMGRTRPVENGRPAPVDDVEPVRHAVLDRRAGDSGRPDGDPKPTLGRDRGQARSKWRRGFPTRSFHSGSRCGCPITVSTF